MKSSRSVGCSSPRRRIWTNPLGSLWLVIVVLVLSSFVVIAAEEQTCEADGTCHGVDDDNADFNEFMEAPRVDMTIVNASPFRADVYWDDDEFGVLVGTVEANGNSMPFQAVVGHEFFVTRHGTKQGLVHLETDQPYRFTATAENGQEHVIPKEAAPSSNPCQDRFSSCNNYAEYGSCHSNPGWMIVHCCKACEPYIQSSKYIDPKVRCSREHLNVTEPIWKPGDLQKLFHSWATDPQFSQWTPRVLSAPQTDPTANEYGPDIPNGPWVMTFDTFFTADEANSLIRGGEMMGFDRSTDQGKMNDMGEMEKVVSKTRTSSNAWCTAECSELDEVQAVTKRIEQVTQIPRKHYESFQILEYTADQFYRKHHDTNARDETPAGHRILTFFLYLTDVEEGGETYFTDLDLAVRPLRGRALVWPSVTNDDPTFWDKRMYHEARNVIRGTKYAANHWIHLYDYEGPNKWGCTGTFA